MLVVSRMIAWGLTRMMKDLKSTYVNRASHLFILLLLLLLL